jgi:hypothetical protein
MLPDVTAEIPAMVATGTDGRPLTLSQLGHNQDKKIGESDRSQHEVRQSNTYGEGEADPNGQPINKAFALCSGASQGGTPAAIRTRDLRSRKPPVETHINTSGIDTSEAHHQTTETQLGQETRKTDPDLDAVIASWDGLPSAVKAGIMAMVKASGNAG